MTIRERRMHIVRNGVAGVFAATWLAAAPLSALGADAPAPPVGGEVSRSASVTATVEDIDVAARRVTLKDANGVLTTLDVDEKVKNLPQVKKGDRVVATYEESIAYSVNKSGHQAAGESMQSATAKLGEKPAAAAMHVVTATATIEAIDKPASKVTLKGQDGKSVTVTVKDPKRLEGLVVGDSVDITYRQALAISVHEAK